MNIKYTDMRPSGTLIVTLFWISPSCFAKNLGILEFDFFLLNY
jgi:hypothetical protein